MNESNAPSPTPVTILPTASSVPATPPMRERRQLIIILTAIEGALLLLPLVFGAYIWEQPVPVDQGSGGFGCVPTGDTTVLTPGASCGSSSFAPALALLVVLAVMLALLVMPVLIGFLSRRWQTAVTAPSIPVWVLTLLAAGLVAFSRSGSFYGIGSGTPIDGYNPIFSLIFATPLILMIPLAAALGGLAWLLHQGFAR